MSLTPASPLIAQNSPYWSSLTPRKSLTGRKALEQNGSERPT
jgi:hypothetical protein